MELLAPAGGMDQLRAALAFGADAVYLAGPDFGMRARAANFEMDELAEAIRVAHDADASVHVTCNVMVNQDDLAALPEFLEAVDAAGANALIIGDLGAFALAREHAPHCQLHVSTQASVANAEAAKMWHSLGASRIVCAREMTLGDIAAMREAVPDDLEIEVFAHGAQCMAVSGRCLISSYLANRSGSRGDCTQPCRWNYSLVEEKRPGELIDAEEDTRGTYIMNAMDLNMLEHLDELAKAGIDSIKIEGRNKKAFYVASVVNAYRQALDGGDVRELAEELYCVSHRPYSTGFFFGDPKQADDYDGYEQETLHVADVIRCDPGEGSFRVSGQVEVEPRSQPSTFPTNSSGMLSRIYQEDPSPSCYRLLLRCRNRFCEGDELEVLSPHEPIRKLVIEGLRHVGSLEELAAAGGTVEAVKDGLGPVEVANRTSDVYEVVSPVEVQPGSFLRARVHRRTSRA